MTRPSRLEAVLFDFDGTLCNTEIENLKLVQGILRQMGADVSMRELEVLTGGEDRVTVPAILERHHARGTIDDYERMRNGCYLTYSQAPLKLEPGALELLDSLRARGVKGLVNVSKVDTEMWEKYVGSERGSKPLGPLLEDASEIASERDMDLGFLFNEFPVQGKVSPADSERLVLRKERLSQQFFRDVILAGYGGRCAISGLRVPELTEAAHIIPWSEREDCRLLPSNGIALNTLLHRAYDADLLGIDEKCRVHVSKPLLKGAEDSKMQAFFESVDGSVLQPSRHFTPSPLFLEERFAGFLERQTSADARLFNARRASLAC